ncbi:MAG: 4Fe-4S dicluster domain-containing protein [Calditrichaeota bacterium]|nr:4Fe-4S dicluster domain-containing protein [Calditrichota bacterium]
MPDSKPRHWTTLPELRGDEQALAVKHSEFYSKPESFFSQEQSSKFSLTGEPTLLSEAAGFVELKVKQNGGEDKSLSRRDFLKLSGAAMVFATAGCGLRPAQKIIPYINQPEEVMLGVPNFYATSSGSPQGYGLLIKTREGRPIKLEGNPQHPLSQGALDARGQYEIFNLYDPDRLTGPVKMVAGVPQVISWGAADTEVGAALKAATSRIAVLTGTVHGPARTKVIADFCESLGATHYTYDAWTNETARKANELSYGAAVLPSYRFDLADYVLCLEADPLGTGYSSLQWQTDFGKKRHVKDSKLNKLVSVDCTTSFTASNADERFRVKPEMSVVFGLAIANALAGMGHSEISRDLLPSFVNGASASAAEQQLGLESGTITRVAGELWAARGKSIVMGGDSQKLQAVACLLNSMLGNEGVTVDGNGAPSQQAMGSLAGMQDLINRLNAGLVDVLIVYGTNPAYSLPESAGVKSAFAKAKTVVHLGDRADETGRLATYLLPGLHWLESWGDAEPQVGLYSVIQPTILPLHDCRGAEESLMKFAQAAEANGLGKFEGTWHDYVMATWQEKVYSSALFPADFTSFWHSVLRDGVLDLRKAPTPRAYLATGFGKFDQFNSGGELQLVVRPSPYVTDDGNGNNAWLLELPHPVGRVCWTNYANLAPKTASKLGLRDGDYVRVTANGATIELPAHVQPGDIEDVVTIETGWGREFVGRVGNDLGGNAFALCALGNGVLRVSGDAVTLEATGRWEELPDVQGHNYTEGRPIVAEATFDSYLNDPTAGHWHEHDLISMYPPHEYKGNKWGMVIDQTACNGCNACIAACSVENNIPVVGVDQIRIGREMHWIRVDRYYSGDEHDPEFTYQPMLCQHCDDASCETVCPVVATFHSEEGLNMQVYNRCVGTRYCSNNCPYKVRRFNWHEFTFAAYEPHPLNLALNPEVTVREKGVMEKCTFCQQRIREGKERAKEFNRPVADQDVKTACQQSCPTNAITFGNTNNPDSQVSHMNKDPRAYTVIAEVNTRPQVTYFSKLRNRPARHGDVQGGHGGEQQNDGGHHS